MIKKSLLVCLLWLSVTATARAQLGADPDSSLRAILDSLNGTRLTLSQVTAGAAQNSVTLKTAEAAYLAARGATRRERGQFDPELILGYNYSDRADPSSSFFAGASVLKTINTDAMAGLRWQLPTGTGIEATLSTVKLQTNSAFAFLDPQYNAFGTLSLRQSLLRGLWVSGKKELTQAGEQERMMKARYDQELLATAADAELTYWSLYGSERNFAVQTLIRDRARIFLRDTELRVAAGLARPSEAATARTFLAEQELLLIDREEGLGMASDGIAELIGVRPLIRFMTTDSPASTYPLETPETLIEMAKSNNLSLEAARADIEAARAMADAAGWEWLPTVNLIGSIGGSGLAGTPQDVIFGSDTLRTLTSGGSRDAVDEAVRRDFPNWSVGLEVSIPIGFRSGLGEKQRLDAELLSAEQRYIDEERRLESAVLQNYRDLANGSRRLGVAREGVNAAQEMVRIGIIEFNNGRTTAFELVRLGTDFATAQNRFSDALVKTATAAATLRQLTSGLYPGATIQGREDSDE